MRAIINCLFILCLTIHTQTLLSQPINFDAAYDVSNGSVKGISALVAADIDGDQLKDVIVFSGMKPGKSGVVFEWLQQMPNHKWVNHKLNHYNLLGGEHSDFIGSALAEDFDNDGDVDFVLTVDGHVSGPIKVYLWENPGHTQCIQANWPYHLIASVEGVHANDMRVADMDADGKSDVVIRHKEPDDVKILFQNCLDDWTVKSGPTGYEGEGLAVGDINNDKKPDISFTGYWFKAPEWPRNQEYVQYIIDKEFQQINPASKDDIGDINLDGRNDVIISPAESWPKYGGEPYVLAWYEAPEDPETGIWKQHVIKEGFNDGHFVRLADFDLDGDLDILSGRAWNQIDLNVYLNENTNFSKTYELAADKGGYSGSVVDMDGDGDIDIVAENTYSPQSKPWFYENQLITPKTVRVSQNQSIQKHIDAANPGDTILLENGTYHETININKHLTLRAVEPGKTTITNKYSGMQNWIQDTENSAVWYLKEIDWPVHWLLVNGIHAFDYRNKNNFENQMCGPYWSKGWQTELTKYTNPPIYFARDSLTNTLWLKLDSDIDPNNMNIDFNSADLDDTTLVQKDLGTYWNQQEIVVISQNPPVYPVTMWYEGITRKNRSAGRTIQFPKICGTIIDINSDHVTIEGLRIHLAPTVGVEVNNSEHVTIRDCYFSGYQFGINTGYECTYLNVLNCEFDGGELVSTGNHTHVNNNMWNHSTYVIPVKFNGTGLTFKHNYVYEGYDLFQPRGRHKDFSYLPDLQSEVAYNVWQQATDNNLEFDGVEAVVNMRFHHNLVLGRGSNDMLAITTTERGNPLMIDHNLFYNNGHNSRIMKLVGTRRTNNGVYFIHNTYITGKICSYAPFAKESRFENNIVVSDCDRTFCWNPNVLQSFFPTKYNLCQNGDNYMHEFEGITADPKLGKNPETFFIPQKGSPAIDAALLNEGYYNQQFSGSNPDLGAIESTDDIKDWRQEFGHCGPTWINRSNAAEKAPHRPQWPEVMDKRWGGL